MEALEFEINFIITYGSKRYALKKYFQPTTQRMNSNLLQLLSLAQKGCSAEKLVKFINYHELHDYFDIVYVEGNFPEGNMLIDGNVKDFVSERYNELLYEDDTRLIFTVRDKIILVQETGYVEGDQKCIQIKHLKNFVSDGTFVKILDNEFRDNLFVSHLITYLRNEYDLKSNFDSDSFLRDPVSCSVDEHENKIRAMKKELIFYCVHTGRPFSLEFVAKEGVFTNYSEFKFNLLTKQKD